MDEDQVYIDWTMEGEALHNAYDPLVLWPTFPALREAFSAPEVTLEDVIAAIRACEEYECFGYAAVLRDIRNKLTN